MKNSLLCMFLFITGVMNAQIVNIPDANFKNFLLNTTSDIDLNNDGEIQVSEAQFLTSLEVYDSGTFFINLQGIEAFTNLAHLTFSLGFSPDLQTINVSALTNLESLIINAPDVSNNLTLNIGGLAQLNHLNITAHDIDAINLAGLTNLTILSITANNLPALDFTDLNTLEYMQISCDHTGGITYGNHLYLKDFMLLAFDGNESLNYNFASFPALEDLSLLGINASNSNISGCSNLKTLILSSCTGLEDLDLTILENIASINLQSVDVQSLFLGSKPNLVNISVDGTDLDYLDLSGCPNIATVILSEDVSDFTLNIKNGNTDSISLNLYDIVNLYACVDEGEDLGSENNNTNIYLSTYCSFTPGGDYNTITGRFTFDGDNNGCSSTDGFIPATVVVNDGTVTGTSLSNGGNYNFYTQAGTFTLTPQINGSWFTVSPATATITLADNYNNVSTQNFCVTANGIHPDVEVVIIPLTPPRPGFDATYKIVYKNNGNQILSGDVAFTYDEGVIDYVSALPAETAAVTGSFTWSYTGLQPFESREILLTLNVNSPMETPAVNIDDVLNLTAGITPLTGDEAPDNNTFVLNQIVVGSFDPNDITCLEGEAVNPAMIGQYLHYNINFENTGTAPATFVVVKDVINAAEFDVSTLRMLDASHDVEARVTGNTVEFYFNNINLAANGGKGNVTFKIKSLNTLTVNDDVTQEAEIFFDYNWPIETNEATTVFDILNAGSFEKDSSVKVYPNPARGVINIASDNILQHVALYDMQGRLLQAGNVTGAEAKIDISNRATGAYFVKITTEKGVGIEKIIKE